MNEYRDIFGYSAVAISLLSFVPYIWSAWNKKTRPHAFSWIVWTVLTGIIFCIQVSEGAGSGAWATGVTTLLCFTVFILALFRGDKKFPFFDWVALLIAFIGILLWSASDNPMLAVVSITIADMDGFVPTFRTAFYRPFEEMTFVFVIASLKWIVGIFAIEDFTLTNVLYPASLVLTNGLLASMLIVRRKQIQRK